MQPIDSVEKLRITGNPGKRHSHLHAQEMQPTLFWRLAIAGAQACLRILDEERDEALTVARIAEVSGAAVGPIYQYFPNKDAIVAMLYECVLDQESGQRLLMRKKLTGVPLAAALREIPANIIRVELRLFKLNQAFHLRYHTVLHLGMWRGP